MLLGATPQTLKGCSGTTAEDMLTMLQLKYRFTTEYGGRTLSHVEYLGLAAGLLTTFALVPQIIRVYKLKSAREISILFNSSLLVGVTIWLAYGILKGLPSLIIWNSIGIVLNGWLLLVKLKYGREKSAG